jgi:hypothetical protein
MAEAFDNTNPSAQPTRRQLVLKASLATLGAVGATGLTAVVTTPSFADDRDRDDLGRRLTDVAILNFALNLEYLEAEFYLRAVTGQGLAANEVTGRGKQGSVLGGRQVPFQTSSVQQYAAEIARDEQAHVDFLRAALGPAHVAEPAIDLVNSFNILAQAAGLGNSFDPFVDENNFLIGAFVFEDVGVTAYHGAARFIENKDYLDAAAGILAVEAYHASNIRTVMYERGLIDPAQKISDLRNALGGEGTDQGIVLNGQANIVPADQNGIAFERTPQEVLNIVYAGGAQNDFGFFPHRVNGAIR